MSRYQELLDRNQRRHGVKFDPSHLDQRFVPYYESGERIKVEAFGEEFTGTVGVTTGWRPAFLLMRRSSDRGSSIILDTNFKILAIQQGRDKYVAVK